MPDLNDTDLLSSVCQYLETDDLEDCEAVLSRLRSAEEGADAPHKTFLQGLIDYFELSHTQLLAEKTKEFDRESFKRAVDRAIQKFEVNYDEHDGLALTLTDYCLGMLYQIRSDTQMSTKHFLVLIRSASRCPEKMLLRQCY